MRFNVGLIRDPQHHFLDVVGFSPNLFGRFPNRRHRGLNHTQAESFDRLFDCLGNQIWGRGALYDVAERSRLDGFPARVPIPLGRLPGGRPQPRR